LSVKEITEPSIFSLLASLNGNLVDDIERGIESLYPDIDPSDIQKTAEKTMMLGETWGMISANPGNGG
jgi:hypothetical protein